MKIRTSFVSNSSSSSFVIATKSISAKQRSAQLKSLLAIPKDHPLHHLANEAVDVILDSIDNIFINPAKYELYAENDGYRDERIVDLLNRGYEVSIGQFATDNGAVEEVLACATIKCASDDLVFESEAYG